MDINLNANSESLVTEKFVFTVVPRIARIIVPDDGCPAVSKGSVTSAVICELAYKLTGSGPVVVSAGSYGRRSS